MGEPRPCRCHPGGAGRPGQPRIPLPRDHNELSGPVPAELGGLANLQSLYLDVNELSGSIPPELGDLANLQYLNLEGNELSGPIPAELGGLANLRILFLGGNELSGPIPAELGGLANLRSMFLSDNALSGSIPPELGRLANLTTLYVRNNELSGPIPAELGGLANLTFLYVSANELSGPIPAELGDLTMLNGLGLRFNQLTGTVPLRFQQLSQLNAFRFGENAGLCLPSDLVAWYEGIEDRQGPVCPDAEVLRALYEAAGGGGWTHSDGWLGDGPVSGWYGVDIDASGRVSTLDLEANGLSGSLPDRLGDLAGPDDAPGRGQRFVRTLAVLALPNSTPGAALRKHGPLRPARGVVSGLAGRHPAARGHGSRVPSALRPGDPHRPLRGDRGVRAGRTAPTG